MKEIPLTQGQVALIDDEDYELVSQYKWYADKRRNTYYAATNIRIGVNKTTVLRMHNLILGKSSHNREIDHINLCGTDNRRSNLRWATSSQQKANTRSRRSNTSGYRGVYLNKASRKWVAQISEGGRTRHIAVADTAEDAARLYDVEAKRVFGDFARLNFV